MEGEFQPHRATFIQPTIEAGFIPSSRVVTFNSVLSTTIAAFLGSATSYDIAAKRLQIKSQIEKEKLASFIAHEVFANKSQGEIGALLPKKHESQVATKGGHMYVHYMFTKNDQKAVDRIKDRSTMVTHFMSMPGYRGIIPPGQFLAGKLATTFNTAKRAALMFVNYDQLRKNEVDLENAGKNGSFIESNTTVVVGPAVFRFASHFDGQTVNGLAFQGATVVPYIHPFKGAVDHLYMEVPGYPEYVMHVFTGAGGRNGFLDQFNSNYASSGFELTADTNTLLRDYRKSDTRASFWAYTLKKYPILACQRAFLHTVVSMFEGASMIYEWAFAPNLLSNKSMAPWERAATLANPKGYVQTISRIAPEGWAEQTSKTQDAYEILRSHADWVKSPQPGGGIYLNNLAWPVEVLPGMMPGENGANHWLVDASLATATLCESMLDKYMAEVVTDQVLKEQKQKQQKVAEATLLTYSLSPVQNSLEQVTALLREDAKTFSYTYDWITDTHMKVSQLTMAAIQASNPKTDVPLEDIQNFTRRTFADTYATEVTLPRGLFDIWVQPNVLSILTTEAVVSQIEDQVNQEQTKSKGLDAAAAMLEKQKLEKFKQHEDTLAIEEELARNQTEQVSQSNKSEAKVSQLEYLTDPLKAEEDLKKKEKHITEILKGGK